jgi:hypothetical protein
MMTVMTNCDVGVNDTDADNGDVGVNDDDDDDDEDDNFHDKWWRSTFAYTQERGAEMGGLVVCDQKRSCVNISLFVLD